MSQFPDTLRHWRKTRRFSQLDLALEAEVSSRHISFLETGRARPSREMVLRLGDAMDLPLNARNTLLGHAGFAPRYGARDWQDEDMRPVREAIAYTMARHAPYPAIAIDQLWTVVEMNPPAQQLYGIFGVSNGDSMLDLVRSDHLRTLVVNWPQVAHHTAHRLRTESAAQGGIQALEETARYLAAEASGMGLAKTQTVVPIILNLGREELSLFATLAQFGTPEDVSVDTLRMELFFPANERSKTLLQQMANAPAGPALLDN